MSWPVGEFLGNQTIVRLRPTPVLGDDGLPVIDPYGKPVLVVPTPELAITYCSVQTEQASASTERLTVTSDLVSTRWHIVAPPDTDLVVTDRVRIDGPLVLDVDGDPTLAWDLDGRPDHLELYGRRSSGG